MIDINKARSAVRELYISAECSAWADDAHELLYDAIEELERLQNQEKAKVPALLRKE